MTGHPWPSSDLISIDFAGDNQCNEQRRGRRARCGAGWCIRIFFGGSLCGAWCGCDECDGTMGRATCHHHTCWCVTLPLPSPVTQQSILRGTTPAPYGAIGPFHLTQPHPIPHRWTAACDLASTFKTTAATTHSGIAISRSFKQRCNADCAQLGHNDGAA